MKWDGKAPEDVGHVRVTKWRDSVTRPFTAQAMVCRGWTRDALRAPAVRTIHVELLASESAIEALSRLLRDIGQWLESGSRLEHHYEPHLYYHAVLTALHEPVLAGTTARVQATFSCTDPRPYSVLTDQPLVEAAFEVADFSFNGKHCLRDMGVLFEETEHEFAPKVDAAVYTVAGRHGTLRFPGAGETFRERSRRGRLYFRSSADGRPLSYAAAAGKAHEVSAWLLGAGRAELIFDYEPDWRCLAEVVDGLTLSRDGWESGRVDVCFIEQPWTEAVAKSERDLTTHTLNVPEVLELEGLVCETDTPWTLKVKNTGDSNITELSFTVDQSVSKLEALSLAPGQSLVIDAENLSVLQEGTSLMSKLSGDIRPFRPGTRGMTVSAKGGKDARLTLEARGRRL